MGIKEEIIQKQQVSKIVSSDICIRFASKAFSIEAQMDDLREMGVDGWLFKL